MIKENTEAIIFDFGGVIINIDYNATIEAFRKLGIEHFEDMYSQAQQSRLFDLIETGEISDQRFINGLLEFLPKGTTPYQIIHAWNAMILDVPPETINLLKKLKGKYKMYLLSNTNIIHIDYAWKQWQKTTQDNPGDLFDGIYLSFELGMRKPHQEIFYHVCEDQNLDPHKTVFIDDSFQHIEGARSIGLQTIHLIPEMNLQDIFS